MVKTDQSMLHDFPDRALRAALADPKNLRDFLVLALPDLAPRLDLTRAKRIEPTFTLEDWREREADLLFEIPYIGTTDQPPVLVCLMVEHQSMPNRYLPMRMLIYAALFWDQEWKEYEKGHPPGEGLTFSAVIPVVFHTGPILWNTARTVGELFGGPEELQSFAPLWPITFWDLAARTPEALLDEGGPFAQMLAVVRVEKEDYERFREVFVEAMRRLESVADDDTMRWHVFLRFLMGWVIQRRPRKDHDPLFGLAIESQRTQAHKREVEMERATLKRTGAEKMYQEIEKEYMAKKEKELAERLEKETTRKLVESRELLLGILTDRFPPIPASLVSSIETCEDRTRLNTAIRKAGTVASLDDFQF